MSKMECLNLLCQKKPEKVPITTVPIDAATTTGLLINFQSILKEKQHLLQRIDDLINPELYVIDRLLFKHGGPFKREKILFRLQQLKRLLKRYNNFALVDKARRMLCLFDNSGFLEKKKTMNIPSSLVCDELLLDLLKVAKLLHQAIHFCFHFRLCVEQKLNLRHYVSQMIGFLAVVSRVWMCCRSALITCIELYAALRHFQTSAFREPINSGTVIQLLKDCNLPDDLQLLYPKEDSLPENREPCPPEDYLRPGYNLKVFRETLSDDVINAPLHDTYDVLSTLNATIETPPRGSSQQQQQQQHLDVLSAHTPATDTSHAHETELDLGVAISRTPVMQKPIENAGLPEAELHKKVEPVSVKNKNKLKEDIIAANHNKPVTSIDTISKSKRRKLKRKLSSKVHDNVNVLQVNEHNSSFNEIRVVETPGSEYHSPDNVLNVFPTNTEDAVSYRKAERSNTKDKKKSKLKSKGKKMKASLNGSADAVAKAKDRTVHEHSIDSKIVSKAKYVFPGDTNNESLGLKSIKPPMNSNKPNKKKKKIPKETSNTSEFSSGSSPQIIQSKKAKSKKKSKRKLNPLEHEQSNNFSDLPHSAKKRKNAETNSGRDMQLSYTYVRNNKNTEQDNVKISKVKKEQKKTEMCHFQNSASLLGTNLKSKKKKKTQLKKDMSATSLS